jgi:hypothetical protein
LGISLTRAQGGANQCVRENVSDVAVGDADIRHVRTRAEGNAAPAGRDYRVDGRCEIARFTITHYVLLVASPACCPQTIAPFTEKIPPYSSRYVQNSTCSWPNNLREEEVSTVKFGCTVLSAVRALAQN